MSVRSSIQHAHIDSNAFEPRESIAGVGKNPTVNRVLSGASATQRGVQPITVSEALAAAYSSMRSRPLDLHAKGSAPVRNIQIDISV
jgi:hypothetical protein